MSCTFTLGYCQGLAQWILSIPGVGISLRLWKVSGRTPAPAANATQPPEA